MADLAASSATQKRRLRLDNGVLEVTVDNGVTWTAVGTGQDPSNVAITGGSIVGVNTATRTVQGAMSADDKAMVDDFFAWQRTVKDTMVAAVPGLTEFRAFKCGENATGTTTAPSFDGAVEGGGLSPTTANLLWFGATVFQNPPGGNWAFACRMKCTALTGALSIVFGLKSPAQPNDAVAIGTVGSIDATHFMGIIQKNGQGNQTTLIGASDALWHNFAVTDDGTTIKFWIDGVLAGSTTTRTNLVAESNSLFVSGATGSGSIRYAAYGYVAP